MRGLGAVQQGDAVAVKAADVAADDSTVVWRLLSVVLQRGTDSQAWLHRVGYGFSGTLFAILAWTAVRSAMADDEPDRSTTIERISAELLGSGLGPVAVLIGGAITMGVGLVFVGVFCLVSLRHRNLVDTTSGGDR